MYILRHNKCGSAAMRHVVTRNKVNKAKCGVVHVEAVLGGRTECLIGVLLICAQVVDIKDESVYLRTAAVVTTRL